MTANKMPEMPEADYGRHGYFTGDFWNEVPPTFSREQVEADRHACYLAGIAAAREAVAYGATASTHGTAATAAGWNSCRELTLANLRTLEEGLKEPALEQGVGK